MGEEEPVASLNSELPPALTIDQVFSRLEGVQVEAPKQRPADPILTSTSNGTKTESTHQLLSLEQPRTINDPSAATLLDKPTGGERSPAEK